MERGAAYGLALLASWIAISNGYLPVIVLHGIFSNAAHMQDMVSMITTAHPGTTVHNIDGYDDVGSLGPMLDQVKFFKQKMLPIFQNNTDGVNMICFSQGGLTCRGILETTPNHNVKTFVSLSSPQAGQFGDTIFDKFFPNLTRDSAFLVFYTEGGQTMSIPNYWKDPYHISDYLKNSVFLPKLNLPSDPSYRENFMAIEDLVLIGGPDDGVISPWQSSHFGFYDQNEQVQGMESQKYFLNDSFGLQTLNSSGKVHLYTMPGVQHTTWHGNQKVFDKFIEPHLK